MQLSSGVEFIEDSVCNVGTDSLYFMVGLGVTTKIVMYLDNNISLPLNKKIKIVIYLDNTFRH